MSNLYRRLQDWWIDKTLPITDWLQLLPLSVANWFCDKFLDRGEWVGDHSEYHYHSRLIDIERDCDNDWQCIAIRILGVELLSVEDWNEEPLQAWIFPGIVTNGSQVTIKLISVRNLWNQIRDRFTSLPF